MNQHTTKKNTILDTLAPWGWSLMGSLMLGGFLWWYMRVLLACFPTYRGF